VARRRWWMLSAWAAILVASARAYPHLTSSLVPSDSSVSGSDSDKVADLIETDFSAAGAEQDVIVFDSDKLTIRDAAYAKVVKRVLASVKDKPGVVSVLGPTDRGARGQVSEDGHAALAALGLSGNDQRRSDRAASLQDTIESAAGSGLVVANLTGYSPSANDLTEVENADVERAESFGIPVAFIVLLLALGAVVAASLPLATAVISLTATFGVISLLVAVTAFEADAFMLSIVTMIGVGVSIDYSLFVLSRFREELVRARADGRTDPAGRRRHRGDDQRPDDRRLGDDRGRFAVLAAGRQLAAVSRDHGRRRAGGAVHAGDGLDGAAGPAGGAR
jgi:putative drug exporter of the RND superfamily